MERIYDMRKPKTNLQAGFCLKKSAGRQWGILWGDGVRLHSWRARTGRLPIGCSSYTACCCRCLTLP